MYITELNEVTQRELKKFCERNNLSFEIWGNPMGDLETATFFFHSDKRLWAVIQNDMLTIYCTNTTDSGTNDDWIFIKPEDYYQLTW